MCIGKPHAPKEKITYRQIKNININELASDVEANLNDGQVLVYDYVCHYNKVLSTILDKHAPLKSKAVVLREKVPWLTEEILAAKRNKRKKRKSGEKIYLMKIGQVIGTNAMSSKTLLKLLGQSTI